MMHVLRRLWHSWKDLAGYIGEFQARLLLVVFYLIAAAPFAVLAYLADPLRLRGRQASGWAKRPPQATDLAASRRQF